MTLPHQVNMTSGVGRSRASSVSHVAARLHFVASLSAPADHLLWHWTVLGRARLLLQREADLRCRMLQMLGNPAAACWQSHSMPLDSAAPPPPCPIMVHGACQTHYTCTVQAKMPHAHQLMDGLLNSGERGGAFFHVCDGFFAAGVPTAISSIPLVGMGVGSGPVGPWARLQPLQPANQP